MSPWRDGNPIGPWIRPNQPADLDNDTSLFFFSHASCMFETKLSKALSVEPICRWHLWIVDMPGVRVWNHMWKSMVICASRIFQFEFNSFGSTNLPENPDHFNSKQRAAACRCRGSRVHDLVKYQPLTCNYMQNRKKKTLSNSLFRAHTASTNIILPFSNRR